MWKLVEPGGSVVYAAGQVGQGIPAVAAPVGGGRILPLGARAVLPRGPGAGGPAPRHRQPLRRVVLLRRLDEVPEQVIVRELGVVDKPLEVQGYLLGGQLRQLGVRLLAVVLLHGLPHDDLTELVGFQVGGHGFTTWVLSTTLHTQPCLETH